MHLTTTAWLPASRDAVFSFFADARNLERLDTALAALPHPDSGNDRDADRHADRLSHPAARHPAPLAVGDLRAGIRRVSSSTNRSAGRTRRWVHTHTFEEENGGTRVNDSVEFEVIASWVTGWLVMRDLRKIFAYRQETLGRIFGNPIGEAYPDEMPSVGDEEAGRTFDVGLAREIELLERR